jgi:hypothetical protein
MLSLFENSFLSLEMRIPSPEWSKMVLGLYRGLLKEGRILRYTDRGYYRREIRREFERQKDEVDANKIKDQYEV